MSPTCLESSMYPPICLTYHPETEVLNATNELTPSPPRCSDIQYEWFESEVTLDTHSTLSINNCTVHSKSVNRSRTYANRLSRSKRSSWLSPSQNISHVDQCSPQKITRDSKTSTKSLTLSNGSDQSVAVSPARNTVTDNKRGEETEADIAGSCSLSLLWNSKDLERNRPSKAISPSAEKHPQSSESFDSIIPSSQPQHETPSPNSWGLFSSVFRTTKFRTSTPKPKESNCDSKVLRRKVKVKIIDKTVKSSIGSGPHCSKTLKEEPAKKECYVSVEIRKPEERKNLPPGMTVEMLRTFQRAVPKHRKRTRRRLITRLPVKCGLCRKQPIVPETSRICGHICCKLCWKEVTITRKKCPVCDAAFSRKLTVRYLFDT